MQFDDRLATVLRSGAAGERAARTQFRQLLDLLGSTPPTANGPLVLAAYARLAEICEALPAPELSRILREPGLRLRNPHLLAELAKAEPQLAAAAMAAARLREEEWLRLVPELPVTARGFLRHRRDLSEPVRGLLARLGVHDLVLPQPARIVPVESPTAPAPSSAEAEGGGIGDLVRRIEAFQKARRGAGTTAPPLPLGIAEPGAEAGPLTSFDFSTDASGRVDWAEPAVAPLLVGLRLSDELCDAATAAALRRRAVVRTGRIEQPGPELVAGPWRIEAAPRFDGETGIFRGFVGRMRRPAATLLERPGAAAAERMRQMLHELRTPVGAIQGFAEIIQQQLIGPVPNSYRALAGAIAVDAARLLAGFDEIDRLARLESGALALSADGCDFRAVIESTLRRLGGVTRPRSAELRLAAAGEDFAVQLGEEDGALLAWRLLATLAGSLAPGEVVDLALSSDEKTMTLECELPISLAHEADLFVVAPRAEPPAVAAGMFGTGFTLRVARAEAEAAGGSLALRGERLVLSLPRLTGVAPGHSHDADGGASAAA